MDITQFLDICLFLFMCILVSTYVTLFLSFWILNHLFRCFSFVLFQELLESLQDSISPVVLSIWMVGERSYPSDLSQTRLGHHSTENQEGLNWKAPHHAFYILHLPLGGYAKSGSSFRERKAGRCWRWLKGWLKLAHSLHEGVPVFIFLHLEIGRSWRSGQIVITLAGPLLLREFHFPRYWDQV